MSIQALDASTAYGRAAKIQLPTDLAGAGSIGAADQTMPPAGGFGAMVQAMVGDAAGKLRTADVATARQIAGKGDLIDVVTAIGAAETALDTVVAVRDRVVSAYSDIMRMQI